MIKIFHQLLGRNSDNDTVVAQKSDEAHDIKNQIQNDIIDIMTSINDVNNQSHAQLKTLTKKLGIVTKQIAIATGGNKRGIK